MAKKASLRTDWKFVFLAASLILLAISVWAVSVKMNTTDSRADQTTFFCDQQRKSCYDGCKNSPCKQGPGGNAGACIPVNQSACKSRCNWAYRDCVQALKNQNNNQGNGGGNAGTEPRGKATPTPTVPPANH